MVRPESKRREARWPGGPDTGQFGEPPHGEMDRRAARIFGAICARTSQEEKLQSKRRRTAVR